MAGAKKISLSTHYFSYCQEEACSEQLQGRWPKSFLAASCCPLANLLGSFTLSTPLLGFTCADGSTGNTLYARCTSSSNSNSNSIGNSSIQEDLPGARSKLLRLLPIDASTQGSLSHQNCRTTLCRRCGLVFNDRLQILHIVLQARHKILQTPHIHQQEHDG